jgi:hypothetical protein
MQCVPLTPEYLMLIRLDKRVQVVTGHLRLVRLVLGDLSVKKWVANYVADIMGSGRRIPYHSFISDLI